MGNQLKGGREAQEFICCQVLEENNQFKSFRTKEQYRIRQDINCKSENVIYLVTCKRCGLQGLRLRLRDYDYESVDYERESGIMFSFIAKSIQLHY